MSALSSRLLRVESARSPSSVVRAGLAASLGLAAFLALPACSEQAEDEPRGGGYVEPSTTAPAGPEGDAPRAKSALGKAKERAERFVNEDVAEYNKKIEDAADGKIP